MIHQYKLNGYNIVLDVNSGSVHLVDEAAYDIIALYGKKNADEIAKEITEKYSDIYRGQIPAACKGASEQTDCFKSTVPAYCARLQPCVQILLCR